MTEFETGYLQALKDTLASVRRMVLDLGTSAEGKVEMLGVVSLLDSLIKDMDAPSDEAADDLDAPDPLNGSF